MNNPNINILRKLSSNFNEDFVELYGEFMHIVSCDVKDPICIFKISNFTKYIIFQKPIMEGSIIVPLNETPNSLRSSSPIRKNYPDLDVTGSPLPCPFKQVEDVDLSFGPEIKRTTSPIFHGFPAEIARGLATRLYGDLKVLKSEGIKLPPIWIACDGKNGKKLFFTGVEIQDVNATLSMTSLGSFTREELPSLDCLNSVNNMGHPLPCLESSAKALYEIASDEDSTIIHLEAEWDRPLSTLCNPRLEYFTTVVLRLKKEQEKSHWFFIQKELDAVGNFLEGFRENRFKTFKGTSENAIETQLEALYASFNEQDVHTREPDSTICDLGKLISGSVFELRSKLSFTDRVWTVLKGCQSISELTKGLQSVFKAVYDGKIRPPIYKQNKTEFAEICRGLKKRESRTPVLQGSRSMEILAQLGLEKIRLDYAAAFKGWDLATAEELLPFLDWNQEDFDYDQRFSSLSELFRIIQAVVTLKYYLKLPNVVLSGITSEMFKKLKSKSSCDNIFKFPLRTSLLSARLKSLSPTLWVLNTINGFEDKPHSLIHRLIHFKKDENIFTMQPFSEKNVEDKLPDDSSIEKETFYSFCAVKSAIIF